MQSKTTLPGDSPAIKVRQAGPEDYAAALPIFQRFYREEGFPEAVDRVPATLRGVLSRDDTAAFLACADGAAVGGAAVSTSYGLEVGLYAELEDLYVDPDWRSRGIASRLVEAACAWAQQRGCSDIEIVLTPHGQAQTGLVAWYEARRFRNTGRIIFERALGGE
jgi:aminoglycoside 6'-N-acetyltransferase I